jgi:hypothetical protein
MHTLAHWHLPLALTQAAAAAERRTLHHLHATDSRAECLDCVTVAYTSTLAHMLPRAHTYTGKHSHTYVHEYTHLHSRAAAAGTQSRCHTHAYASLLYSTLTYTLSLHTHTARMPVHTRARKLARIQLEQPEFTASGITAHMHVYVCKYKSLPFAHGIHSHTYTRMR